MSLCIIVARTTGRHFCHFFLHKGIALTTYRSLDGFGNNSDYPELGQAGQLYGISPHYVQQYTDQSGTMPSNLSNPRSISNAISEFNVKWIMPRLVNEMHSYWAQLLHLDTLWTTQNSSDPAPIPVPMCDPNFDPLCTGNASLAFIRSNYVLANGTRRHINLASSFLDGSAIYGVNPGRIAALRTFKGGTMLMSDANEVPYNTLNLPVWNPMHLNTTQFRLTGDPRANISPQILALVTLFLREHNRYCGVLATENPSWNDETLFQEARRRVVALMQRITYREYIPALLGQPLPLYAGYDPTVDPTMSDFFCRVIMRYGHPEVTSTLLRLNENWLPTGGGNLPLYRVVFNPVAGLSDGVEPVLRGMLASGEYKVTPLYNDYLRDHVFEMPARSPPSDLIAIDIQRGRDHGIPRYNTMRQAFGLAPKTSFESITSDTNILAALIDAYPTVDDIDSIVGALAEDVMGASNLGELLTAGIVEQFSRLRAGDSFWYENNQFSVDELNVIENTRLSDIITRDTQIQWAYNDAFFRSDGQLGGGIYEAAIPIIPALDAEFPNKLDLQVGYRLYWAVDFTNSVVRFATVGQTAGWIGFGISQFDERQPLHTAMYHVDITIGYSGGEVASVADYFSFEIGVPSLDVALGCHDDLQATSLERNGTLTIMRFTKPMVTADGINLWGRLTGSPDVVKENETVYCDTPIRPGQQHLVIFALNPTQNTLLYHGASRGMSVVMFIPDSPWTPQYTLIAIGTAVGVVGFSIAMVVWVIMLRRRRGKNNICAPRKAPFCVMFTDIEKSTLLWSTNAAAMSELIDRHTAIIRSLIARHRAFEVKTIGDSFMVAAREPQAMARLAVDIQLALHREAWSQRVLELLSQVFPRQAYSETPGSPRDCWHGPRVRMGVHHVTCDSGVVVELDHVSGSYDYFGPPINIAARVESLACGGQILLSSAFTEACPSVLWDPSVAVHSLGFVVVRGVPTPVEVYELMPVGLTSRKFPPLAGATVSNATETSRAPLTASWEANCEVTTPPGTVNLSGGDTATDGVVQLLKSDVRRLKPKIKGSRGIRPFEPPSFPL